MYCHLQRYFVPSLRLNCHSLLLLCRPCRRLRRNMARRAGSIRSIYTDGRQNDWPKGLGTTSDSLSGRVATNTKHEGHERSGSECYRDPLENYPPAERAKYPMTTSQQRQNRIRHSMLDRRTRRLVSRGPRHIYLNAMPHRPFNEPLFAMEKTASRSQ